MSGEAKVSVSSPVGSPAFAPLGWTDLFSSSAFPGGGTGSGSDHVSHTPTAEWSFCPPRGGDSVCPEPDPWAAPPLRWRMSDWLSPITTGGGRKVSGPGQRQRPTASNDLDGSVRSFLGLAFCFVLFSYI